MAHQILKHIEERESVNVDGAERTLSIPAAADIPTVPGYKDEKAPSDAVKIVVEHPNVIDKAVAAMPEDQKVWLTVKYPPTMSPEDVLIAASIDLGYLLLKVPVSALSIEAEALSPDERHELALGILQATRRRISRTEYIACPSCGRTLFDLQTTLAEVKKATKGLTGLKIGVMGCIVNGPGEMADADYGYVGAGPGRVSIYRGNECVAKNIPAEDALARMMDLIKADGHKIEDE